MARGLAAIISERRSDDWLTPRMAAAAETEPEGWGAVRTYISPSSAGVDCPLDAQLAGLGHSTGFNEKSRDRMDNGTAAEQRIVAKMERAGLVAAHNLPLIEFADGFVIFENLRSAQLEPYIAEHGPVVWRAALDVLIQRSDGANTLHIGELKTCNIRKWERLPGVVPDRLTQARLLLRSEPKYTRQGVQYLVKFQKYAHLWRPDVRVSDEMFLLYEHTDSQEYKVFWFSPDEAMRADAFKNADMALEATREGRLLDRPFERGSRTCNSCFRKRVCNALSDEDEGEWQKAKAALATAKEQLRATPRSAPTAP